METDSQLVIRAQTGDQQAFAELIGRHSARVFRLAVSILGREFIPEAEDVTQEVFLKVHHAIQSFRGEAEFSSWIYRIAFNQAVNLKARVRFRSPHADESVLYWLGAGLDEVAALLGIPENTAKSYLHRARQLLRGMLKERGYSGD